jgi:hypothetical protein
MINETRDLIEEKILQLRILTDANWKEQEYELAVLGERVLRTIELSKSALEELRRAAQSDKSVVTTTESILIG